MIEDIDANVAIAELRSEIYGFIVSVINTLPDKFLLNRIKEKEILEFIICLQLFENEKITEGSILIKNYISKKNTYNEVTHLGIDRTRLFRAYGVDSFLAPNESNYHNKFKDEDCTNKVMLRVVDFYRKAGVLPAADCTESPDFLSVELDFMRILCEKERMQWLENKEASSVISLEQNFLTQHLCQWVKSYCGAALKIAKTDFYKGLILLVAGIVEVDEYNLVVK